MDALSLQPRRSPGARCAICHDDVEPDAELECEGCRTLVHRSCHEELGGCPTLGCDASAAIMRPASPRATRPAPLSGPRTLAMIGASTLAFAALDAGFATDFVGRSRALDAHGLVALAPILAGLALGAAAVHLAVLPVWFAARTRNAPLAGFLLQMIACTGCVIGFRETESVAFALCLEGALISLLFAGTEEREPARAARPVEPVAATSEPSPPVPQARAPAAPRRLPWLAGHVALTAGAEGVVWLLADFGRRARLLYTRLGIDILSGRDEVENLSLLLLAFSFVGLPTAFAARLGGKTAAVSILAVQLVAFVLAFPSHGETHPLALLEPLGATLVVLLLARTPRGP